MVTPPAHEILYSENQGEFGMKLRKILAVVLALALVCATFGACGNDAGTSSTSGTSSTTSETETGNESASEAETGSTGDSSLNIRVGMEPTSLNTLKATYSQEFATFKHMYENLYMLDENDVPQPAAAETVDVSEDGMTYTFHLRDDGVWSNGDPVTANDFAFAWQQALSPEVAADYAYFLFFIKNAEAYLNGTVEWEEVGVKVIDDLTLEVQLENPTPYAPFLFTFGTLSPINQKFYEEVGADNYGTEAEYFCTNGAYNLTSWTHDSEIVLTKNPNYHGADGVAIDTLNMKIISDGQAALTSFLAGELDVTEVGTAETLKQAEDAGYEVKSYNDGSSFYLMVNCSDPQLSNVNLRRALALGYSKQGFIDVSIGLPYSPMTSFTNPAVNGFDGTSFADALIAENGGELAPAEGDVEAAKAYLETALSELGITADQLTLSIDCQDSAASQTQAAFLQNQWLENLGIDVTINPKVIKQGSADRQNGNYQMSITGWGPDYNDPMTFLDLWVSDGGNNDTRWASEEYDNLIAQATVETDLEARQELFYQAEKIIFDQYMILPLYNRTQSFITSERLATDPLRSTFQDFNYTYATLA